MKKGVLVFGIIAWIVIIVLVIFFILFRVNITSFVTSNFFGSSALIKEETFSVQGLNSIIIKNDRKSIEIVASDTEEARVYQYGRSDTPSEDLFTITESNGNLSVNSKNELGFVNNLIPRISREIIIIELPASWTGDMEVDSSSGGLKVKSSFEWKDVRLGSSSGGINLEKSLSADNLDIDVSSGGISADGELIVNGEMKITGSSGGIGLVMPIKADIVEINTTSGTINIHDINTSSLKISNSSGRIMLGEVKTNDFYIKNDSGGVTVAGLSGTGDINGSSGGISVKLIDPVGKVNLKTASGSINITVEESLSFSFSGVTSSGGIKANFPLQQNGKNSASAIIGSDPVASITATAASGGINISQ
jgi:hypothetical protein